jgi:S1-C subfamily serine protease
MKHKLAILVLSVFASSAAARAADPSKVGESVFIVYEQNYSGGMEMRCTATAFEGAGKVVKFLTAAHCVTQEVSGSQGKLVVTKSPVFLSDDRASAQKSFVKATIETVGRPDEGYDFAILAADVGDLRVLLTPLGDERQEKNGTEVLNIAAPGGLGKVYFSGHVALLKVDRPLIDESSHINWEGFMLCQLPAAGGSSGSAIISVESGKIIGLVIGSYRNMTLALPASRLESPARKNLLRQDGKDITAAEAAGMTPPPK